MLMGRREIFTDASEITSKNIISVLREAVTTHTANAFECEYLLNYEKGQVERVRKKTYRSDIDNWVTDPIPNEIVEFKLGFNWSNPITLIQRGDIDSGVLSESDAIALLNECYEAEGIKKKTQELARYIEITGIGYTFVDVNTEYEDGDSYFSINVLDPRCAFVVKSSRYLDHRPILGVTYRKDSLGNTYYTCFTKDRRYEIVNIAKVVNGEELKDVDEWNQAERSGERNPLGMIPIIEWIRSHDRMGCFEREIPAINNLALLISDYTNDVDQNTQAIWWGNNIKFDNDEKPSSNDWVLTRSTSEGKPDIKPLTIGYDYNGMLNNIVTQRSLILQRCNVPSRNTTSGGSTGIAMDSASGWNAAESSACKEQNIIESCKMEEVKVVLKAIKKSRNVPVDSPLRELRHCDVKPNIKRQKTYELTTKANFFATVVSHGINGRHALEAMNAFEDVNQVWEDSKEMIEMYQASVFAPKETENNAVGGIDESEPDADRISQDESDQSENSPSLKG